MPKYMVIAPTYLRNADEAAAALQPVGTVVIFDGEPGVALAAMDDAAAAAKAAIEAEKARRGAGRTDAIQHRRHLERLPRPFRIALEAAQKEFGATP